MVQFGLVGHGLVDCGTVYSRFAAVRFSVVQFSLLCHSLVYWVMLLSTGMVTSVGWESEIRDCTCHNEVRETLEARGGGGG